MQGCCRPERLQCGLMSSTATVQINVWIVGQASGSQAWMCGCATSALQSRRPWNRTKSSWTARPTRYGPPGLAAHVACFQMQVQDVLAYLHSVACFHVDLTVDPCGFGSSPALRQQCIICQTRGSQHLCTPLRSHVGSCAATAGQVRQKSQWALDQPLPHPRREERAHREGWRGDKDGGGEARESLDNQGHDQTLHVCIFAFGN